MSGWLGLFGPSREMQGLDRALRAAGLYPRLVPDAVKLTALKVLRETGTAGAERNAEAAELLAYCVLGAVAFTEANGRNAGLSVEARLEAALDASDSLDARLVLLTLHAALIEPGVVARYELESD